MKCEKCNQKTAKVYYKQIINGSITQLNLCQDCAQQANLNNNFFGGLDFFKTAAAPSVSACKTCGLTKQQLQKTGRVGCSDCYSEFSDILLPYIRSIHKNTTHVGAVPHGMNGRAETADRVAALKRQLELAVAKEDFETAARVWDEIKTLTEGRRDT